MSDLDKTYFVVTSVNINEQMALWDELGIIRRLCYYNTCRRIIHPGLISAGSQSY